MVLNPSNSSSSEQLALKGLTTTGVKGSKCNERAMLSSQATDREARRNARASAGRFWCNKSWTL